jgi:hypothetical protein
LFTANYVQGAQRDVGENVKTRVVQLLSHFLHQHFALLLEHLDEVLKNFEVESRRQDFPSRMPFRSFAQNFIFSKNNFCFILPVLVSRPVPNQGCK